VPSVVTLGTNKLGKFNLILKVDCGLDALKQFTGQKNLIVEQGKEEGYCVIRKP